VPQEAFLAVLELGDGDEQHRHVRGGREKVREYAARSGSRARSATTSRRAGGGYADVVAPPMFAAVYSWRALAPAVFDPEVGIDFARLVHGGQDFTWHAPVVAGDEITTEAELAEKAERAGLGYFTFTTRSVNQRGEPSAREMAEYREMRVTPDRYLTYRYAGASGDFNPIHLDDEFARSVGLPGRILHGLWTMAQVARAEGEAAGDPLALRSLSVQFRGLGVPRRRSRSPPRSARSATASSPWSRGDPEREPPREARICRS